MPNCARGSRPSTSARGMMREAPEVLDVRGETAAATRSSYGVTDG